MNYLYLFALCLALVSCSIAIPLGKPTGQPGCQTEAEIAVGAYRHYYLKNQYWVCHALGVPASLATCPVAQAWLDDAKACVYFAQWYWTPTVAPPSQPLAAGI
ncbi:uncharacterized protein [Drosophila virilis]|uniref:Chitin-binding type-2 domain-containing protein n=1 Tax=Drosophila virilis TaxID=7244 RepID=B4LWB5_DROVI|nr:uncharacterized protein LOC6631038 [Drosophila virilis]EDW67649.1 uncharacterized protein Dvir_GJ24263 [Drosophila virilis]